MKRVRILTLIEIEGEESYYTRITDCSEMIDEMIKEGHCDGSREDIVDIIRNDEELNVE